MTEKKAPMVAVDAIIESKGCGFLLVRRGRAPYKGRWALPGGFVKYEEGLESAVRREVKEETGLSAKKLELFGAYSAPSRDPRGHVISIVYACEASGRLRAGDDACEAMWFSSGKMPSLAFDHKRILVDYKKRGSLRTSA